MNTHNPVFRILFPKNGLAPLASGNKIKDMSEGQIGIFDSNTKLSVDSSDIARSKEIFLAVKGAGDTVYFGAHERLQKRGAHSYTLRCSSDFQEHIVDITNFTNVSCETDYTFRIVFSGNTAMYQMYGYTPMTKSYSVRTGCCEESCACPDGNCNELAKLLVDEVNRQEDGIVLAQLLDYGPATPIVVTDYDAWVAANPGACLGVRLTTQREQLNDFCNVPLKYQSLPGYTMEVSVLEPLGCDATVTTFQEMAYAEGDPLDMKYMEYQAAGFDGSLSGTARAGNGIGLAFERNRPYQSDLSTKYIVLNLEFMNHIKSGGITYDDYIRNVIAIPCEDAATLAPFVKTLDAWLADSFDSLFDDLTACSGCDGFNSTSVLDDETQDGIG